MAGSIRAGEFFFDAAIKTGQGGLMGGAFFKDIGKGLQQLGARVGATGGVITGAFTAMALEAAKFSEEVKKAGTGRLSDELQAIKNFSGMSFKSLVDSGSKLQKSLIEVSAALKAVRLSIAQAITPQVVQLTASFVSVMSRLFRTIQNNKGAFVALAGAGTSIAALGAAVVTLGTALGVAATLFTAVAGAIASVLAAVGALLTPLGALVALVGLGAGAGLVGGLMALTEWLSKATQGFEAFGSAVRASLLSLELGDFEAMGRVLETAFTLLGTQAAVAFTEAFGAKATKDQRDSIKLMRWALELELKTLGQRVNQQRDLNQQKSKPFGLPDLLPGTPGPPFGKGGVNLIFELEPAPIEPIVRRSISGILGPGIIGGQANQRTLTGMIQGIEEKQLKEQEKTNDLLFQLVEQNEQNGQAAFR